MKRVGRQIDSFEAERLRGLVRHLYFQLGKLEREVASELGISRRMVNYYKNQKKR
jgi:DNA-binding transcriptional regulator LsrR (DeoR family)